MVKQDECMRREKLNMKELKKLIFFLYPIQ